MPDLTSLIHSAVLYSTPLILAAIGGLYSERSGVVNIGLEGLMITGAFTAAVTTIVTGNPWIGLAAAVVAGVLMPFPTQWLRSPSRRTRWSAGWRSTSSPWDFRFIS